MNLCRWIKMSEVKNRFFLKKLIATIALVFLVFGNTFVAEAQAAVRGRVKIQNNTVVSDTNNLLRGAHMLFFKGNWWLAQQPSYYENLKNNFKVNTIRLFVYREDRPEFSADGWFEYNDPEFLSALDETVRIIGEEGMYAMITYGPGHNGQTEIIGHPNDLQNFWSTIASRYKNNTHVLYEVCNEPVSWSAAAYSSSDIATQENIYSLIRNLAPNTHVVLWTFATIGSGNEMLDKLNEAGTDAISYNNASVGYHAYDPENGSQLLSVKSNYPVFMTEFLPTPTTTTFPRLGNTTEANNMISWHESNSVSWILLEATDIFETKGVDVFWQADDSQASSDTAPPSAPINVAVQ